MDKKNVRINKVGEKAQKTEAPSLGSTTTFGGCFHKLVPEIRRFRTPKPLHREFALKIRKRHVYTHVIFIFFAILKAPRQTRPETVSMRECSTPLRTKIKPLLKSRPNSRTKDPANYDP